MDDVVPMAQAAEAFSGALLDDDPVALYERAPCGYLSTTPDGLVLKANTTFLTWTGYTAADLVGRPLVSLLAPGDRIFHETHYAPMLRMQGFVREIAVELVRTDGSRFPVLLNATLDRDERGQPRVTRLAVFDATERRRYEQELLRATESARAALAQAEAAERRSQRLVDTLQQTLVPARLPTVDGLELHGVYRPAGSGAEVGGDFYDVFTTSPDECWLVLGDVSGKGVEAAVVTSLVRHAARALTLLHDDPAEVLDRLNALVHQHETDRYCTAVVVRLRRCPEGGWWVRYGSGGHPPPLLCDPGTGARQLDPAGQIVGVLPDAEFETRELHLAPGQTLLLYTDGVTEGRGGDAFYGERRLVETAAGAGRGARAVVEAVVASVLAFQDDVASDDIACLAVSNAGPAGSRSG